MTDKTYRFIPVLAFLLIAGTLAQAQEDFFVPAEIPFARHVIEAKIDLESDLVEGRIDLTFNNTGKRNLEVIAFGWRLNERLEMDVKQDGKELRLLNDLKDGKSDSPLFYRLAKPARQGDEVKLKISFRIKEVVDQRSGEILLGGWFPRLSWDGLRFASSYKVKFNLPEGYTEAASGLFNPETGYWEVAGAKNFGIYLGKDLKVHEADVAGVKLRVLYPEGGEKVAKVAFEEARKVIPFYKKYAGFFPFKFLNIIPGGSGPWGGYPFNPGTVVIHGMKVFEKASLDHWQWITAHEIGHQYWGDHVLEKDNPDWLWIAMGIYMDREYWLSHGHDNKRHSGLMSSYHHALSKRYDTTIDIPISTYENLSYDHNNLIQHGKAVVVISALDWLLGKDQFKKVVLRALDRYKWKRFGFRDLWRLCQEQSGEELTWFFDQWVRSDAVLCYKVVGVESEQVRDGVISRAKIKRIGDMKMPLPVRFVFEDGSHQDLRSNRMKDLQVLEVKGKTAVKEVMLDPDNLMAMLKELPPRSLNKLKMDIRKAYRKSDAVTDLDLYNDAVKLKLADKRPLLYLGMLLYGGEKYQQAIEIFKVRESVAEGESDHFLNNAWLGLLHDLTGKRDLAIRHYQISLKNSENRKMQHGQYKLLLDQEWLKKRLEEPYKR